MNCPFCGDLIVDPFFMILGQGMCASCFRIIDIRDISNEKKDEEEDKSDKRYHK